MYRQVFYATFLMKTILVNAFVKKKYYDSLRSFMLIVSVDYCSQIYQDTDINYPLS